MKKVFCVCNMHVKELLVAAFCITWSMVIECKIDMSQSDCELNAKQSNDQAEIPPSGNSADHFADDSSNANLYGLSNTLQ